MDREIVHVHVKTSWWDGTVTALCGQKYKPGHYRKKLFELSPVSCPGCKAAEKAGR